MPEELGFEKRVGNRRAIDGDERRRCASGVGVDVLRDDVLADAAFAGDEDLGVACGGAGGQHADLSHRPADVHQPGCCRG